MAGGIRDPFYLSLIYNVICLLKTLTHQPNDTFCGIDVIKKPLSKDQCDQMASLFVHSLASCNTERLPKTI